MSIIMKQIRGTEISWLVSSLILEDGQLAYDTTNNILKMGNGINLFKDLLPVNDSEHCDCPTILDENGKIIESLLPDDLCNDLVQEMEDRIAELEDKLNQLLYVPVESLTLNETTLTMTEGDTTQLIATILPENATNKTVTWTSSDTTIAEVNGVGLVTTKKDGSVTITCTSNDKTTISATCNITIESATKSVTGVTISPTTKTIAPGETFTVTNTITPTDATNKNVTYSSTNTSIATVDPNTGLVTGIASGSCIIRVTTEDGNFTSDCSLNVETVSGSQEYNTPGTYTFTVPNGVTSVRILAAGGGGGGAGASQSYSGYSDNDFSLGRAEEKGGDTSFGSIFTLNGGQGGGVRTNGITPPANGYKHRTMGGLGGTGTNGATTGVTGAEGQGQYEETVSMNGGKGGNSYGVGGAAGTNGQNATGAVGIKGGGGGGASSNMGNGTPTRQYAGGGGGGGAYFSTEKTFSVTPGQSYEVIIGAGAKGGISNSGVLQKPGGNGGDGFMIISWG